MFFIFGGEESPLFRENKAFMAEPSDWPPMNDGTSEERDQGLWTIRKKDLTLNTTRSEFQSSQEK